MKEVVVFYQGKEVTRVKCDELVLMGNGFKLLTEGKEVARFLNDYDYALQQGFNITQGVKITTNPHITYWGGNPNL